MAFPVTPLSGGLSLQKSLTPKASEPEASFADVLSEALGTVNQLQKNSENVAASFARGEDVEIHSVMLAAEEASLAFNFMVSMRNRLLEAYQEVMRMQV